jgi:hypothetical protein
LVQYFLEVLVVLVDLVVLVILGDLEDPFVHLNPIILASL